MQKWSMEVFQFLQRKFAIQTWFCNCPQYFCLFHIVFECSPNIHDPRKMLVLPNRLLYWIFSTSDRCFVSFQLILCHPHTQIRIILFHDERRDIPNLEFSPIHVSIGLSQITFPIIVLPKGDHTDSFQEERLDLPYWTMMLAVCVVVDESKCMDIPIWEFSIICEHLPFLLGYKLILRLLHVLRNQAVWRWSPWRLLLSFEMLKILDQWILQKIQNHPLQHHLGVQLDLFVFLVHCLQLSIFGDRCPLMMENEL